MAEHDHTIKQEECASPVESQDRGLFDFMGKKEEKKPQEETISHEFEEKVHVTEPEHKVQEDDKHESLIQKLTRSDSSSSSSSEEEVEEGGEKKKKKKKLKEKIKEKISGDDKEEERHDVDTSIPVEKIDEAEEKKGFLDRIKEKLPGGGQKKGEEVPPHTAPGAAVVEPSTTPESPKEKKGILEKIKEKLPGYHPKGEEEKEKEKVEGAQH